MDSTRAHEGTSASLGRIRAAEPDSIDSTAHLARARQPLPALVEQRHLLVHLRVHFPLDHLPHARGHGLGRGGGGGGRLLPPAPLPAAATVRLTVWRVSGVAESVESMD